MAFFHFRPTWFLQHYMDSTKEGVLKQAQKTFEQKAASIGKTVRTIITKGEYPSKMKVFSEVPGVSLADGRNPKLAEIWKRSLVESRSDHT